MLESHFEPCHEEVCRSSFLFTSLSSIAFVLPSFFLSLSAVRAHVAVLLAGVGESHCLRKCLCAVEASLFLFTF